MYLSGTGYVSFLGEPRKYTVKSFFDSVVRWEGYASHMHHQSIINQSMKTKQRKKGAEKKTE